MPTHLAQPLENKRSASPQPTVSPSAHTSPLQRALPTGAYTPHQILQMQSSLGNRAVGQLLKSQMAQTVPQGQPIQRQVIQMGKKKKKKAEYDPTTNKLGGGRPDKTAGVETGVSKATSSTGVDSSAHHKYPWNAIKDDINTALGKSTPQETMDGLKQICTFADVTPAEVGLDSDFEAELALAPTARTAKFTTGLNALKKKACWTKWNLMLGPTDRSDDPQDLRDEHHEADGSRTPRSELAHDIEKAGGILNMADLSARLTALASRDMSTFDETEWDQDSGTKKYKQKV